MTLAVVYSRAPLGIQAPLVTVETHLLPGLPAFSIVGLPETTVKESKERVRSAIINSHFEFPTHRITVNLAPADLPKEGGRFDLPIALGILAASAQLPKNNLNEYEFVGELALSGELRPIQATLPIALGSRAAGRALILPIQNGVEATFPGDNIVYPATHLLDVHGHLTRQKLLIPFAHPPPSTPYTLHSVEHDLSQVRGQFQAKRALEIAAAGNHNLLMFGPPGSGKTLLASCLSGISPPLTTEEALEVVALHSLCKTKENLRSQTFQSLHTLKKRICRSPHHTASSVALVGGGTRPKPGEISLAHHGILFLDELPEFDRKVLEVLREPLESGTINIARAARTLEFPAKFQLIAAMNPCPCGYLGDIKSQCRCTKEQVQRYRSRISGPLLDRIDMHIELHRIASSTLIGSGEALNTTIEDSATVHNRIMKAYERQQQRSHMFNSRLSANDLENHCKVTKEGERFLQHSMEKLGLSARAYHRILRVARTIADLSACQDIQVEHLKEALSYRKLDRVYHNMP